MTGTLIQQCHVALVCSGIAPPLPHLPSPSQLPLLPPSWLLLLLLPLALRLQKPLLPPRPLRRPLLPPSWLLLLALLLLPMLLWGRDGHEREQRGRDVDLQGADQSQCAYINHCVLASAMEGGAPGLHTCAHAHTSPECQTNAVHARTHLRILRHDARGPGRTQHGAQGAHAHTYCFMYRATVEVTTLS